MVSTIRFRSFKTFDLQSRRSYCGPGAPRPRSGAARGAAEYMLVVMAYTYLASGFIGYALTRLACVARPRSRTRSKRSG